VKQLSKAVFVLLLLLFAFQSNAIRIYVDHTATGQNTGTHWTDAYTNLQAALSTSQAGDTIWVAQGTYLPTAGTNRNTSFVLKSKVALYGGFAGYETDLSQRNWMQHATTLSGDIGVPGDTSDNAYTILYMKNPDLGTVVNGFRFEYGMANDTAFLIDQLVPSKCGGAIFIQAVGGIAYPDIVNCTFFYNYAIVNGGAVFVNGTATGSVAPRFIHCTFDENRSKFNGSAVDRYGGSKKERFPDFSLCTFTNNVSFNNSSTVLWSDGPGIDTMQFDHCVFDQNRGGIFAVTTRTSGLKMSIHHSSFLHGTGSSIIIAPSGSSFEEWVDFLKITDSEFDNNAFSLSVINVDVTPPPAGKKSRTLIDQCNFKNNLNMGDEYGLIYLADIDSVLIDHSRFESNNLTFPSTLLDQSSDLGNLTIRNTVITHNKSPVIRRGLQGPISANLINVLYEGNHFDANEGVYFDFTVLNTTLQNCTFARDTVLNPNLYDNGSPILFRNCAFRKNVYPTTPIFKNWAPGVTFDHCYFDALNPATLPATVTLSPNTLISNFPLFVNDNPGTGDYHLQPCSPLIDAGIATGLADIPTDLDGNPRLQNANPDIGAYEAPAPSLSGNIQTESDCNGQATGSVAFIPLNGCGAYTYNWQSGTMTGTGTNHLTAGSYRFTITDSHGHQIFQSVIIGGAPVLTPVAQPVDCKTGTGGSASLTIAGGLPPYSYYWSGGSTTDTLFQLAPGQYPVTVTDVGGCMDSTVVSIVLSDTLPFSGAVTNIPCYGAHDGMIDITTPVGMPPFSYNWASGQSTASLTNCAPGTYLVTVSDGFGCTGAAAYDIAQPDSLTFLISVQNATGPQTPDGSVFVNAYTGGSPPYSIQWNTGASGDLIEHLAPGTYSFTVTDADGCTRTRQAVVGFTSGTTEPTDILVADFYPNPVDAQLNIVIQCITAGPLDVCVYNSVGVLVNSYNYDFLDEGTQWLFIPTHRMPGGVYLLQLKSRQSVISRYFQVVH
jgi:hypothetical protein